VFCWTRSKSTEASLLADGFGEKLKLLSAASCCHYGGKRSAPLVRLGNRDSMLLSISSSTQIERGLAGVRFVCRQRYKQRGTARGSYALL
jgi:hypothetical protein